MNNMMTKPSPAKEPPAAQHCQTTGAAECLDEGDYDSEDNLYDNAYRYRK